MTAIQLRDELNKQIELGRGDATVSFDAEAGAFEIHLVEINALSYNALSDGKTTSKEIILHTDEPIIRSWKEI